MIYQQLNTYDEVPVFTISLEPTQSEPIIESRHYFLQSHLVIQVFWEISEMLPINLNWLEEGRVGSVSDLQQLAGCQSASVIS